MGSRMKIQRKSVGSFWKTNPPEGVYEGSLIEKWVRFGSKQRLPKVLGLGARRVARSEACRQSGVAAAQAKACGYNGEAALAGSAWLAGLGFDGRAVRG